MDENSKSRTFELKQRLLRRAWDGESKLAANGKEMIMLIQMRLAQCQAPLNSPDEKTLQEVKLLDADQPRSVRMLNALARQAGSGSRFSKTETLTIH